LDRLPPLYCLPFPSGKQKGADQNFVVVKNDKILISQIVFTVSLIRYLPFNLILSSNRYWRRRGSVSVQAQTNSPDQKTLKRERDVFIKLAFCRADLLFELDENLSIIFSAGATEMLFSTTPEELKGSSFLKLVDDKYAANAADIIHAGGDGGRIDDAVLKIKGSNGVGIITTMAGFKAEEFNNHYFLALKIGPAKENFVAEEIASEATDHTLMDQESFSQAAAKQLTEHTDDGGQMTMVNIRNVKDLIKTMGASDRHGLMSSIGEILKSYSFGGKTAGQLDDENFGYVHGKDIDPEVVNVEIEEAADKFLPEGQSLETKSTTLDADGADMSEEQVAKALVYTMDQFVSNKGKLTTDKLSDSLEELMDGTVQSVKYIKDVTKDQDFDLVFMPICDLRLGKVHHFEALSRFRDPEKAKTTFQIITLAENLGLIIDFDEAVLDKSINLITDFWTRGPMPSVAVNLSSLSLSNDKFVKKLHKRLKKDDTLSGKIMFELTESAEIENLEQMNATIQSFRDIGFKFSLDDFGAGAASFDYLNALDVDIVKFDGPVIRRACASKRGKDLLSTMAKMCTTSGIQTVAEMVEDKNVSNQVFYCGIDYGQGWYFGKPDGDPFSFEDDFVGAA